MRIWTVLGWVFGISYIVTSFGLTWDFFDLGASTKWEQNLTGVVYAITALFCFAVDDILKAVRGYE